MCGPVLGGRKKFCVFVEEGSHGFVATLAEEVSFADGFVGERGVEGEGGRGQEHNSGEEHGYRAGREMRHSDLLPIRR